MRRGGERRLPQASPGRPGQRARHVEGEIRPSAGKSSLPGAQGKFAVIMKEMRQIKSPCVRRFAPLFSGFILEMKEVGNDFLRSAPRKKLHGTFLDFIPSFVSLFLAFFNP